MHGSSLRSSHASPGATKAGCEMATSAETEQKSSSSTDRCSSSCGSPSTTEIDALATCTRIDISAGKMPSASFALAAAASLSALRPCPEATRPRAASAAPAAAVGLAASPPRRSEPDEVESSPLLVAAAAAPPSLTLRRGATSAAAIPTPPPLSPQAPVSSTSERDDLTLLVAPSIGGGAPSPPLPPPPPPRGLSPPRSSDEVSSRAPRARERLCRRGRSPETELRRPPPSPKASPSSLSTLRLERRERSRLISAGTSDDEPRRGLTPRCACACAELRRACRAAPPRRGEKRPRPTASKLKEASSP